MELMPGYKMTEVGVIPVEWECAPLSREIEGLDAGISVNSFDSGFGSYEEESAVLKTSAISGGKFLPHESKVIAPRDIDRAKLNPCKDSIIISRMNTPDLVGECGYVFADFPNLFLPDRLWMTRNRRGSDVCVQWLNYLLSSKPYKTRIKGFATGTSGSMKNIAKDALLSMVIPYPRSPEQRAIAQALSDVDALLASLDQVIAKKRDLKQAVMQQLLTGKTRLPGFSGDWTVKQLKHVAPLQRGFDLPNRELRNGPYPVVYSNGVINHHAEFQVQGPGVVTGRSGTIGKVTYLEDSYWPHNTALWVTSFENNDPRFIFYLYTQIGLERFATGSGVPTLNRNDVHDFEVAIPPTSVEQSAIATALTDMDTEIFELESRRDKTRNIKQAMMQELLTGKTRLV